MAKESESFGTTLSPFPRSVSTSCFPTIFTGPTGDSRTSSEDPYQVALTQVACTRLPVEFMLNPIYRGSTSDPTMASSSCTFGGWDGNPYVMWAWMRYMWSMHARCPKRSKHLYLPKTPLLINLTLVNRTEYHSEPPSRDMCINIFNAFEMARTAQCSYVPVLVHIRATVPILVLLDPCRRILYVYDPAAHFDTDMTLRRQLLAHELSGVCRWCVAIANTPAPGTTGGVETTAVPCPFREVQYLLTIDHLVRTTLTATSTTDEDTKVCEMRGQTTCLQLLLIHVMIRNCMGPVESARYIINTVGQLADPRVACSAYVRALLDALVRSPNGTITGDAGSEFQDYVQSTCHGLSGPPPSLVHMYSQHTKRLETDTMRCHPTHAPTVLYANLDSQNDRLHEWLTSSFADSKSPTGGGGHRCPSAPTVPVAAAVLILHPPARRIPPMVVLLMVEDSSRTTTEQFLSRLGQVVPHYDVLHSPTVSLTIRKQELPFHKDLHAMPLQYLQHSLRAHGWLRFIVRGQSREAPTPSSAPVSTPISSTNPVPSSSTAFATGTMGTGAGTGTAGILTRAETGKASPSVAQRIAEWEELARVPYSKRTVVAPEGVVVPHMNMSERERMVNDQLSREGLNALGAYLQTSSDVMVGGQKMMHWTVKPDHELNAVIVLYLTVLTTSLRYNDPSQVLFITVDRKGAGVELPSTVVDMIESEFGAVFGYDPVSLKPLAESACLSERCPCVESNTPVWNVVVDKYMPTLSAVLPGKGVRILDALWQLKFGRGRVRMIMMNSDGDGYGGSGGGLSGGGLPIPWLTDMSIQHPLCYHVHVGTTPYRGPCLTNRCTPHLFIQLVPTAPTMERVHPAAAMPFRTM